VALYSDRDILTASSYASVLLAATYDFYRLRFKADVIEPVRDHDLSCVVTPVGTFQMTKAEVYRDFDNVVRSRGYRDRGLYHYPPVPDKALKYVQRS